MEKEKWWELAKSVGKRYFVFAICALTVKMLTGSITSKSGFCAALVVFIIAFCFIKFVVIPGVKKYQELSGMAAKDGAATFFEQEQRKQEAREQAMKKAQAEATIPQELTDLRLSLLPDINVCLAESGLQWSWPYRHTAESGYVEKDAERFEATLCFVPGAKPLRVQEVRTAHASYINMPLCEAKASAIATNEQYAAVQKFLHDDANLADAVWYFVELGKIRISSKTKGLNGCDAELKMADDGSISSIRVLMADGKTKWIRKCCKCSAKKTKENEGRPVISQYGNGTKKDSFVSDAEVCSEQETEDEILKHYEGLVTEASLAEEISEGCAEAALGYDEEQGECVYAFPAGTKTWSDYSVRDKEAEWFAQAVIDNIPNIYGVKKIDVERRKILFLINP